MDYNDGGMTPIFLTPSHAQDSFRTTMWLSAVALKVPITVHPSVSRNHNTVIEINKYQNFVAKLDLSQKALTTI